MALIALRIKAEIPNITYLFTLLLHFIHFHSLSSGLTVLLSVSWMSLSWATGALLMLISLLDALTLFSPLSHLTSQPRNGVSELLNPHQPLQLNTGSLYCLTVFTILWWYIQRMILWLVFVFPTQFELQVGKALSDLCSYCLFPVTGT